MCSGSFPAPRNGAVIKWWQLSVGNEPAVRKTAYAQNMDPGRFQLCGLCCQLANVASAFVVAEFKSP